MPASSSSASLPYTGLLWRADIADILLCDGDVLAYRGLPFPGDHKLRDPVRGLSRGNDTLSEAAALVDQSCSVELSDGINDPRATDPLASRWAASCSFFSAYDLEPDIERLRIDPDPLDRPGTASSRA